MLATYLGLLWLDDTQMVSKFLVMEHKDSSPWSQKATNGTYLDPVQIFTTFSDIHFDIILPSSLGIPHGLILWASTTNILCLPHVLILSFLT